jgi:hydroxyquinol 1,2-dioxygenase
MRNFNEENITGAVLAAVRQGSSSRDRQVSEAVVRHLHALVQELRPTQDEWRKAIDFLTETGKYCSATRQEFILLSDALGVSMLVDAINHNNDEGSTPTTVLGPFYYDASELMPLGSNIANTPSGDLMHVEGRVRRANGEPIQGAVVEVWHADHDGFYDVQLCEGHDLLDRRAAFRTDDSGRFWFRSRVPLHYPIPADGPVGRMLETQGRHPNRPAHVHFMITAADCEQLVTHVFLEGDPYLDSDVVFGVKDGLIVKLVDHAAGETRDGHLLESAMAVLHYDFVLADG